MKLVFLAAGESAVPSLMRLRQEHEIALVATPPPRPAGRKMAMTSCPAAKSAQHCGLPLIESISPPVAAVIAAAPQALVVCDYGALLPQALLSAAPWGALDIHFSLLPRWRGAAPVQHALLAGDIETGISIMQMDEELDTGPILRQQSVAISPDVTGGELSERLAQLAATVIGDALAQYPHLAAAAKTQDSSRATYAAKFNAAHRVLDFSRPAEMVHRQVRAFAPSPCAHTVLRSERIKIAAAAVALKNGQCGEIIAVDDDGIVVACALQSVKLLRLQRAGKKMLPAGEFLRGFNLAAGEFAG